MSDPDNDLLSQLREQPDSQAEQIAREEISRHYASRVATARAKLEKTVAEMQRQIAAAETAKTVWEQHGEITSSSLAPDPREASSVRTEALVLLLTVEQARSTALAASWKDPQNQQLLAARREATRRVEAVRYWLATHGNPQDPAIKSGQPR